jgi:SAM-dependent methyltransferase
MSGPHFDESHVPGPQRSDISPAEASRSARQWWDSQAADYLAEHGAFLDRGLIWGPEGWSEAELRLLGPLHGKRVLDLGCGAGQTSQWLASEGAEVTSLDISRSMLGLFKTPGNHRVQADAHRLPFQASQFDLVVSAYGALPFSADIAAILSEAERVLLPHGRLVYSVTHPFRWAFPDDPNQSGLTINSSYFDRRPYVEVDDRGQVTYSEHHRTIGDWVDALRAAGFTLERLVEPEWPASNEQVWGGWSPLRGRVIPGTAIFIAERS